MKHIITTALCTVLTWSLMAQVSSDAVAANAAGEFNVRDFGAKGDAVTDDTEAIQGAIDAVGRTGGTLRFPPGIYIVTTVGLRPGVRYLGYGATIKRPARQGKWVRTFNTAKPGYLYSSDTDSAPLILEGFRFDGNRSEQDEYDKYQLEQAHLLFLMADRASPGRLRAQIINCEFRDAVADAISVYTNADVQIVNCAAYDCFRGGMTLTGGNTRVQISNLTTQGKVHPTGIDVEVDGSGYGDTKKVELFINGLSLRDGDFDCGVSDHSVVVGTNIVTRAPVHFYGGGTSEMRFSNSVFGVGNVTGYANRLAKPGNVTFDNCRFLIDGASSDEPQEWAAINIYWSIGSNPTTDQTVKLVNCDFSVGSGIAADDTTYAVLSQAFRPENGNRLQLIGGTIAADFDYGVFLRQGGHALIRDTVIRAETALYLSSGGSYYLDVLVDGIVTEDGDVFANIVTHSPQNRIEHRNIVLDESMNVLQTKYGLSRNQYVGQRLVLGATGPTATTAGLLGDRYRLKIPRPNEVYEWICTTSGAGSGSVWKPLTRIEE